MASAKELRVERINSAAANAFVRVHHYSGKVVPNSQLHFGVFLAGTLHGVMSFGPPTDKRKILPLVVGTPWNGMLELNRMAFDAALPRNSESRAISVAMRLLRKHAPHVQWVLSFADATQCGSGTIYRASGFHLVGYKENKTLWVDEQGGVHSQLTFSAHRPNEMHLLRTMKRMVGYQIKYIYPLDPTVLDRLTVPILPFTELDTLTFPEGVKHSRGVAAPSLQSP